MLALARYKKMISIFRGRVIYSGKLILRAWKTYKINQKYQVLLEEHRNNEETKQLEKYEKLKLAIVEDIKEIQQDIALAEKSRDRLKARLLELDSFLVQCAFRVNKIKIEMSQLVMDDFEKGSLCLCVSLQLAI
jgi:hypothetical protein